MYYFLLNFNPYIIPHLIMKKMDFRTKFPFLLNLWYIKRDNIKEHKIKFGKMKKIFDINIKTTIRLALEPY